MRLLSLSAAALWAAALFAQGTLADYQRAQSLAARARELVVNRPGAASWIGRSHHFWYSRSVKGGAEFLWVDADTGEKRPAFDHERLAAGISKASGEKYTAWKLPIPAEPGGGRGPTAAMSALVWVDEETAIQFGAAGFLWKCALTDYVCSKVSALGSAVPAAAPPAPDGALVAAPEMPGGDPSDGLEYQAPPQAGAQAFGARRPSGCAPLPTDPAPAQPGAGRGGAPSAAPALCRSFDGKWDALIQNYNIFLQQVGSKEPAMPLSYDGSEGNSYTFRSIAWSPDSTKLAAYRTRPGYDRQVHYVESSPADQIQPKHSTISYRKPGDALDIAGPVLFDIASRKGDAIDPALFPNAYSLSPPVWWKDSRGFTFEYNERGHQVYRVIEVDAQTGKARALIDERSKTFIYYNPLGPGLSAGRRYRHDIADGKEIIWASERDGWEHLYLYNGHTGEVKNAITKGEFVVRNVDFVDDENRQVWFEASGMNPGQDPYFTHYYRVNFDGSGLTRFTDADGNHTIAYSADRKYYVDTWSRVDLPTISQLRRTEDRAVVLKLEKTDASALLADGIRFPEVFVAKGRDGKTDIWGVIIRPGNFDPAKKYPVIENIYAGPQGSFVPKSFAPSTAMHALAELGFVVVQIDGMGTSNRSKAFHDVAWKNLGDAGFPDRILWHQAAAAKYPWYDITRVGIYGTSAGGQSALGGALFHPDFYKVVVTNSGCHDNRMDKIWWNEQWMGWPVGPQYAASSNVDNAYRLKGRALIIVPEMDTNVDPSSSLQVVNALIKAKKHFDMLLVPEQNHGAPVLADQHYLQDYFVHYLLGVEPPDWNHVALAPEPEEGKR